MQNWLVKLLVNWLIANLTEEKIKEWTDAFKKWVMPIIVKYKVEVFAKLREAAKETTNTLDDAAVDALEKIVDQFIK